MPTVSKESSRRLDPAKVVDSALLIADTEGLDAVTLRRLAQVHEVTPMALYRHFSDSSNLLADNALPEPSDEPWQHRLRDILTAFVAALRPHPNVAGLTLPRILVTESGLELAARTLELLTEGGFSPDHAAAVGRQSICALISLVATEPGAGEDPEPAVREQSLRHKRVALGALDPKRYPGITGSAHVLVWPASVDAYYALGIDLIVAGVTGVLARQDKP